MEYKGKLYGKIGGKYIEITQSVEDLENKIKELDKTAKENELYIDSFEDNSRKLLIAVKSMDKKKINSCLNGFRILLNEKI